MNVKNRENKMPAKVNIEMTSLVEDVQRLLEDFDEAHRNLNSFEEDLSELMEYFVDALDTIKHRFAECDSKTKRLAKTCFLEQPYDVNELPF